MPSLYSLKPKFQGLLRPFAGALARAGVTANQVTVVTCVLSIGLGILLTMRPILLLLPGFLLVRMALNAVDGMLALEFGQKTQLGAFLNELADVVSDSFLYLPFAYVPGFDPLWIGAVIVLSVISEMAGALAATRRYDGPMGKSDRAFVFGAVALWLGLGGKLPPPVTGALPVLLAVLVTLTIVNRVRGAVGQPVLAVSRPPGRVSSKSRPESRLAGTTACPTSQHAD